MSIKLTTLEQVALLRKGDIIKKCATNINAKDAPNKKTKTHIDTYEVRSVNLTNEMVVLVMSNDTQELFSWPGDVDRLFIKSYNLIAENVWWLEPKTAETTWNYPENSK